MTEEGGTYKRQQKQQKWLGEEPSTEEIQRAINNMKLGQAQRCDEVLGEYLKNGGEGCAGISYKNSQGNVEKGNACGGGRRSGRMTTRIDVSGTAAALEK